jgi:isopentenyldiphosphate isomerase
MSGDSEQFEVLDEQGHKTGRLLDRETVHAQQLWHEVVNVWLLNTKGDVLLQLRGPNVDLNPNVWDVAVGTHVRPNEDPTLAAQRCLQSELGITITPDNIKHLFNIQSANPLPDGKFHNVLGHVFLVKRDLDIQEFTYDTNKVAKLVWRSLVEVMAEIGSSETSGNYHPRPGEYYPKLLEALQAEMV